MGRQKVKILSFFLAVFIAVAAFPALKSNAASNGSCGSNVTWTLDDNGKLTIQGSGAMTKYTSASAVPWYSSRSNITTIEIKSGVTTISDYAFRSHTKITSVSIPSTVTYIGSYAFNGCSALTSVTIPNSVTEIGGSAFMGCSKLATVTLSSKLTAISEYAFKNCSVLTSISIPNGVTKINQQAFYGCKVMTTCSIPSTVTSIGQSAFQNCAKLNNVTLPSGLDTLGRSAFNGCTSLTSITVPRGITTLQEYTFSGCKNLTTASLPSNLLKLETGVFQNCSKLSTVNIPNGILSIGDAFVNCTSLTSFTIPSSVQEFGELTLSGTGVREVTYNGTHDQFLGIHVLVDDEEMTMDDVFAKLNISVVFAGGSGVSITTQPSNFTGKCSTTASFSVKAQGEGLTYKWYEFNGEEWVECKYTGYNTSTLKVSITCDKDGNKYCCEVRDAYGNSVTSNNATLTIDRVPLKINTQPANCSDVAGGTATFSVKAQGDELTYQWQVNKGDAWTDCSINASAKTSTLSFEIKDTHNGYKYRCVVSDGYGESATSNAVTLTVLPDFAIVTQPSNCSLEAGSTANFTVVATGSNLTYQWQVNTNGTWKDSALSGYDTATLTVAAYTSRNGYKFRCVVTDGNNQSITSNEATLTVTQSIAITSQPVDATVTAGSVAKFTVDATGNGLKYQWQVNTNGTWKNSSLPGYNTATLSVDAFTSRNGYAFRCIVKDSAGNTVTSRDAILKVVSESLTITAHPSDYSGAVGSVAKFTVAATGTGLKYQWQVYTNGAWKNSSLPGYNTATLSVDAFTSRNGYKFRCVVKDSSNNSVTSNAATLTVTDSISITSQPSSVTATAGSVAKFTVAASGTGLKYQWQVYANGAWKNSSLPGYNTATLSVDAFTSRNGYKFRCVIKDANNASVTSNEATLTVTESISITSQPADVTAPAGSVARFTVVASGTGLKYQWQVYTNGSWKNSSLPGYNTATLSVDAFTSRNGYKFRCIVKDANNSSVTSREATLTVNETIKITAQPENTYAVLGETAKFTVTATGTGLTYQWQVYKDGAWKYSSLPGYNTATLSVEAQNSRNGYKFRCIIKDANGVSVISDEASLKIVEAPLNEGFQNLIDLADNTVVSEPANEVVIVDSDADFAEETEIFETVVEEAATETKVFVAVDEQVS